MAIVPQDKASDYAPNWKWRDDEVLEGRHVELRKANSINGEVVVWEIGTENGPVSVWIEPAVLRRKLTAELARRKAERGSPQLEAGERVRINPGTKRPSKTTAGQSVWPFPEVWLEHGVPDKSAEDLLLDQATLEPDDETLHDAVDAEAPPLPRTEGGDDDIPF